mmetsp:Transcript_30382/g.45212  ORF Transcript_30382/g.45212 Transcript_30382/m.45212 type:complete len:145 (+) Transcript_30382:3-437(+)
MAAPVSAFAAGCLVAGPGNLTRAFGSTAAAETAKWDGKVMLDLCVVPIGSGVSVRKEVARAEKVLRDRQAAGKITCQLHAYGTNIYGDWDEVIAAVKETHEVLHNEMGVQRLSCSLRMGTRIDKSQTIQDKVNAVEDELKKNKQ